MENIVDMKEESKILDRKETKKYKRGKIFERIATVFFIFVLLLGGVLIWHNSYYTVFFVNGQSMYPTLNENATRSDGSLIGPLGGSSLDGDRVQFGIMDTSKKAINKIERGDIIITYYKDDYSDLNNLILNKGASTKIKRVVGLPGEKVAIDPKGYILINDVFTHVKGNPYYSSTPEGSRAKELGVLGDDEYFVLGDNRDNSMDSTSARVGAIKKDFILGVAVATEGTCKISSSKGVSDCINRKYKIPKFF